MIYVTHRHQYETKNIMGKIKTPHDVKTALKTPVTQLAFMQMKHNKLNFWSILYKISF